MSRDIELEALAKGLVNAKQDTHGWPTVEYLRGAQDAGKEMLAILAKPSPGTLHGELRELADKKAWDVASHIWTDILRQRGEYEGWFDDQVAAKELILSAFLASHPAPAPETRDQIAYIIADGYSDMDMARFKADRILALFEKGRTT